MVNDSSSCTSSTMSTVSERMCTSPSPATSPATTPPMASTTPATTPTATIKPRTYKRPRARNPKPLAVRSYSNPQGPATPTSAPLRPYADLYTERAYLFSALQVHEATVAGLLKRCVNLENRMARGADAGRKEAKSGGKMEQQQQQQQQQEGSGQSDKTNGKSAGSDRQQTRRQLRSLRSRIADTIAQQQTVVHRLNELCIALQLQHQPAMFGGPVPAVWAIGSPVMIAPGVPAQSPPPYHVPTGCMPTGFLGYNPWTTPCSLTPVDEDAQAVGPDEMAVVESGMDNMTVGGEDKEQADMEASDGGNLVCGGRRAFLAGTADQRPTREQRRSLSSLRSAWPE